MSLEKKQEWVYTSGENLIYKHPTQVLKTTDNFLTIVSPFDGKIKIYLSTYAKGSSTNVNPVILNVNDAPLITLEKSTSYTSTESYAVLAVEKNKSYSFSMTVNGSMTKESFEILANVIPKESILQAVSI